MKKSILSIFFLFLLIIPISGCGSDENEENKTPVNQYSVSVSLEKANSETEQDFSLFDCARIVSGHGKYDEGSNVTVKVEFISNACLFNMFVVDGVNKENVAVKGTKNVKTVEYTINNLKSNVDVKSVISMDETSLINGGFYFNSFTKTYIGSNNQSTTTEIKDEKYEFPYLNSNGKIEIKAGDKKFVSVDNEEIKLNKAISPENSVDLNYIYLNGEFKPYKLTWYKGEYLSNYQCSYSEDSVVEDINNLSLDKTKRICLSANIDLSGGEASNEIKKLALDNMVNSEIYISKGSATEETCGYFPSSGMYSAVTTDCMYVANMKGLYSEDNTNTIYYGVLADNRIEAVTTASNYSKNYLLCKGDNCNNSTYKVHYDPTTHSKNLVIYDFIKTLGINSEGYQINVSKLKLEYNYLKGIVVTEINDGTTAYKIQYISNGEGFVKYQGGNQLNQSVEGVRYAKFNFVRLTESDDNMAIINPLLDELESMLNGNIAHLMYKNGEPKNNDIMKEYIYSIINENENLKQLKKYYYSISIDDDNVINVSIENKALNLESFEEFIVVKEGDKLCAEESCLSTMGQKLITYVGLLFEENIVNLTLYNITEKSDGEYEYKFIMDGYSEIITVAIALDAEGNLVVKSGETSIKLMKSTLGNLTYESISVEEENMLGKVNQTLSSEENAEVVTTINGIIATDNQVKIIIGSTEKIINIDIEKIQKVKEILTNYKVYSVGDKYVLIIPGAASTNTGSDEEEYGYSYIISEGKLLYEGKEYTISNLTFTEDANG